jgi:hypothetical protein
LAVLTAESGGSPSDQPEANAGGDAMPAPGLVSWHLTPEQTAATVHAAP